MGCGDDGITLDQFNAIEPGDTKAEVETQLGAPAMVSTGDVLGPGGNRAVGVQRQWHYCSGDTKYTITIRDGEVSGSQYATRPNCPGSD